MTHLFLKHNLHPTGLGSLQEHITLFHILLACGKFTSDGSNIMINIENLYSLNEWGLYFRSRAVEL